MKNKKGEPMWNNEKYIQHIPLTKCFPFVKGMYSLDKSVTIIIENLIGSRIFNFKY